MSPTVLERVDLPSAVNGREEDKVYEIVNGVPCEVEPKGAYVNLLASELFFIVHQFARRHRLGLAVIEAMFLLRRNPILQRKPDIAFVSKARRPRGPIPRQAAWEVAPDLAVEIVSPTNLADEVDAKVVEYFEAGVRLVWVLFPETRRMYVYESLERMRAIGVNDQLDGGDILPGFSIRLGDLFAALEDPDATPQSPDAPVS